MSPGSGPILRVGLIGRGAIGSVVARRLSDGSFPAVTLAGILRRTAHEESEVTTVEELLARGCDLVVEAAGHRAVAEYGPAVVARGVDLVVLSSGSLAQRDVEASLRRGPGRLMVSTGAIGGLDIARAMAESGALERVTVRSTTVPAALPRRFRPSAAGEPALVLSGSAREVALEFPKIANVAATTALATLGLDAVTAELWVDPAGSRKRHVVELEGGGGSVRVEIVNRLSEGNPQTSAVTPFAVLRLLRDLVEPVSAGV